MAARRGGLGKGLDSLIPETIKPAPQEKTKVVEKIVEKVVEKPVEQKVKLSKIGPREDQPRKQFDEDSLAELAESIKQFGVIQPLVVQEKNGFYEIIAGERRWRAAKMAGLKEVPVIIKKYTDLEIMEISLIENIQRENLNPIEEAEGYQVLMSQYNMTQEETAQRVGKSRSAVANALRLLNLCPPVRAMVEDGRLTNGHARALLPLSPALQETTAATILKNDLSVRQTEQLVKKLTAGKKEKPSPAGLTVDYAQEAARDLGNTLGRGCRIVSGKKKGRIELEYYGVDDLNELLEALHTIKKP